MTKYQRCNFIIQIHKFTVKIDTISINLLFECVKIVEFLKFQFPRVSYHVSRDTFSKSRCIFLKSRKETTVFDHFCFREGLKTRTQVGIQDGLIVSIFLYIPNANEFFESLLSLLQQCGDCVNENTDGGHAEFLAMRLEEYQRTLRVMYGRVTEWAQDYCGCV